MVQAGKSNQMLPMADNPSYASARKKVIDALSKKPETKTEWEKVIQAAEEMLKLSGAQ